MNGKHSGLVKRFTIEIHNKKNALAEHNLEKLHTLFYTRITIKYAYSNKQR